MFQPPRQQPTRAGATSHQHDAGTHNQPITYQRREAST